MRGPPGGSRRCGRTAPRTPDRSGVRVRAGSRRGRGSRDDPARAGAHHEHARAHVDRLGDRVGDEQAGELRRLEELEELVVEPLARDLVERAERLVEEERPGLERQHAGERGAHLHAAGERDRVLVFEALQATSSIASVAATERSFLLMPSSSRGTRRSSARCAGQQRRVLEHVPRPLRSTVTSRQWPAAGPRPS